jgi:hypothetical protein
MDRELYSNFQSKFGSDWDPDLAENAADLSVVAVALLGLLASPDCDSVGLDTHVQICNYLQSLVTRITQYD